MWVLLAIASAITHSAGMIIEKKTLLKEHAMEFCAAMSLFAMLFTLPLWFYFDTGAISLEMTGWTLAGAVVTGLALLFMAKALRHMALSFTSPFIAFGPLITALLAILFLGEKLAWMQLAGVLIIIAGTYMLASHSHENLFEPFKHLFRIPHMKFVWLGLLFYALTGLVMKHCVGEQGLRMDPLAYIALMSFFLGVFFVLSMLLFHDGFHGIGVGLKKNRVWLSGVAVMHLATNMLVIFGLAIPGVMLSLFIPLHKLNALFSTMIGGELFHEDHILRKAIAATVMIVGVIFIIM